MQGHPEAGEPERSQEAGERLEHLGKAGVEVLSDLEEERGTDEEQGIGHRLQPVDRPAGTRI